jgi:hypothetical protein
MKSTKISEFKHYHHKIDVLPDGHHAGKLVCKECKNAYIKWISDIEYKVYKHGMTFKDLQDNVWMYYQNSDNMIYLAVPFIEKDKAKKLGAKWDPVEKLWYTYLDSKKASNLKGYMLEDDVKRIELLEKYNRVYGA